MMKRTGPVLTLFWLLTLTFGHANDDASGSANGNATPPVPPAELLEKWEYFAEVGLPGGDKKAPLADFVLTPEVFDKARHDLGDLRLYDAQNRPVPYKLMTLHGRTEQQRLRAREFDRSSDSSELKLDLDESPPEYNSITIKTEGTNFRRRVQVEGSNDLKEWITLLKNADLVNLPLQYRPSILANDSFNISPPSRLRYLRVRVFPDKETGEAPPVIQSVEVYHSVQMPAEDVTRVATLGERQPVPTGQGPGSAWIINLGGRNVPCDRLNLEIADPEFDRAFRLESLNLVEPGNQNINPLNRDAWRPVFTRDYRLVRRTGARPGPLEVRFREVQAQRFRLTVTDAQNKPLDLKSVTFSAPVRQVIFKVEPTIALPLRLYVGNPQALPPLYDFAESLPARLEPPPVRVELGAITPNPDYLPPEKPWTERWPWLIYVVLGLASLVLLGILAGLARETMRQGVAATSAAG